MFWICAVFSLLTSCYILTSILLFIGVSRLKKSAAERESEPGEFPFASVLVAARNEEERIANCLESLVHQNYPSDRYEIVVVNDRSTDKTGTIIGEYQKKCNKMIKCVSVDSKPPGLTGKQNALNEGLKFCAGEIILNTDADCIVGQLWIRRTVSRFTPQVGLTMGFSTVSNADGSRSFFADLQSLDMLFLMDSAAGAIGVNVPASGLGRNLAYRREILSDVDYLKMGYTITEDAVLIQTVARNTDWRVAVVYDRDASVLTVAEKTVKQFLSQRIRWVMGGQAARLWSQIPLHIIFVFHLCLVIFFPLMFFMHSFIAITLLSIFAKAISDFVRCWRMCREFRCLYLLKLFVFYEIFMIFYSILTGIGSVFIKNVKWKGEAYMRNVNHTHSV